MPPPSLRPRLAAPLGRRRSATQRALLQVAREHFAAQGYAGTSLDVVVAGAEVTKGALYHHFTGKQALFEAVFTEVEDEAAASIRAAVAAVEDPWEQASAAVQAFLVAVRQPAYRRIVVQDGPAVLGLERSGEREQRSSYLLVRDVTEAVLRASSEQVVPTMVDTFSRILFGAMSAAGESIADADDVEAATVRVELAMAVILDGLRSRAAAGLRLEDPAADQPAQPTET